jgi:hypothetical protein
MERTGPGTPHAAVRLTRTGAKVLAGLSIFTLALAVGGVFLYDGWHRVAYVTAFVAMSLVNLITASGSFLPLGRARRALRVAVTPLAVVMMIALGVTLAFQFGWAS